MLTWELPLETPFSFKSVGFSKFFYKKSLRSWSLFEMLLDPTKKCLPSLILKGWLFWKLILTVPSRNCWICVKSSSSKTGLARRVSCSNNHSVGSLISYHWIIFGTWTLALGVEHWINMVLPEGSLLILAPGFNWVPKSL